MHTAQDLVAHLLASTGGGAQDGEHQAVRHAVINGVREVMQSKDWLWHTKTHTFTTTQNKTICNVQQNSNTIHVVNPEGFVVGRDVDIDASYFANTPVKIVRVSGNNVTLDSTAKSTGSAVPIETQVFYDLPYDLDDLGTLKTNTVGTLHCYISPEEWQHLSVNTRGNGEPYYYTVMRSDMNPDRYQVRFVGFPQNSTKVHMLYRLTPKPIKYFGYERSCREGTVTLTNVDGQMTVTGTKTNFPQDCASCFIRFGAAGMPADPNGSTTPFIMERRIEKWESLVKLLVSDLTVYERPGPNGNPPEGTSWDAGVIDTSAYAANTVADGGTVPGSVPDWDGTIAYSNLDTQLTSQHQYAITDVLNASPQMWTACISGTEMWYARIAGKPADVAMAVYNRDLRLAMEADVVMPISKQLRGMYPTPRSMGWHSDLMPDVT